MRFYFLPVCTFHRQRSLIIVLLCSRILPVEGFYHLWSKIDFTLSRSSLRKTKNMRHCALLLLALWGFLPRSQSQCPLAYICTRPAAEAGSTEEKWEQLMLSKMKILEKKFGVPFENGWSPRVSFTVEEEYAAQYERRTHSFKVTFWYQWLSLSTGDSLNWKDSIIINLLGHELGHALAEQISYRVRCAHWPDTVIWQSGPERKRMVQKILSEGVGNYFGSLLIRDTCDQMYWLPKKKRNCTWNIENDWMYHAGLWVVKPILDTYGERGLLYVMNNTAFPGKSFNLRKAGKKYQKSALRELSK
jgi:hypothetical protein